jgi:cobalt-zinc-cadmium resistance protein CzcA
VRLNDSRRQSFNLNNIYIHTADMQHVPVSEVTELEVVEGPVQIQREDAKRRITIGVNVRDRDVETLVEEIEMRLQEKLEMPAGYFITYGGAFENLQSAKARLMIAVPAALLLILFLLYVAFGSVKESLLIFSAVPLSAVGGVLLLQLRDLPFSISAGVGFIALFGVAVLNGIVLISYFRKMRAEHPDWRLERIIETGALIRLRPVIMTALVAMLGFMPMAFSVSEGAEVQRPLATVVIGGLITSTLLTLVVLPAIYLLAHRPRRKTGASTVVGMVMIALLAYGSAGAQSYSKSQAIDDALQQHPLLKLQQIKMEQDKVLRSGSLDLGQTELGVQYGQINAPGKQDYYFEAIQNFGNPVEIARMRTRYSLQYERDQLELEMKRRELSRDVAMRWNEWALAYHKWSAIQEFLQQFNELHDRATQRLTAGDIGELEYGMVLGMQAEMELTSMQLLRALVDARAALSLAIQSDVGDDWFPDDFERMDTFEVGDVVLAPVFTALFELNQSLANARINESQSAYFPSMSLGYFNQQIEGAGGLSGVKAGLTFPLWYVKPKSEVSYLRLEQDALDVQQANALRIYQQSMQAELVALETLLAHYSLDRMKRLALARSVFEKALNAYQLGEFSYLEFFQAARAGVSLELNYWDIRMAQKQSYEALQFYIK